MAASVLSGMVDAGVQTDVEETSKTPRKLTEVDIVRRLSSKMIDEVS
jgi:hypothetical protein